jgi:pantothenate kinase
METTYDTLAANIAHKITTRRDGDDNGRKQYWIGISGVPGSGKTTLAAQVRQRLNQSHHIPTQVIPMDGYHYYRAELDKMDDPKLAHERRGAHWTFNASKFVTDLSTARENGVGSFPGFDHSVGDPHEGEIALAPGTKVCIVEGLYLLMREGPWAGLDGLFDESWFISINLNEASERVIRRHMKAWNWDEQRARNRVMNNDYQNALLVDDTKFRATQIIQSVSHS